MPEHFIIGQINQLTLFLAHYFSSDVNNKFLLVIFLLMLCCVVLYSSFALMRQVHGTMPPTDSTTAKSCSTVCANVPCNSVTLQIKPSTHIEALSESRQRANINIQTMTIRNKAILLNISKLKWIHFNMQTFEQQLLSRLVRLVIIYDHQWMQKQKHIKAQIENICTKHKTDIVIQWQLAS